MAKASQWPPAIAIEVCTKGPPRPLDVSPWRFPDCTHAPGDGPVALGGDFSPEAVIAAYRAGAFPWPQPFAEYAWFSPDPRAVLPLKGFHVSRRLARTIRQGRFRVTVDRDFPAVIQGCAEGHAESWVTPALSEGYRALHEAGWAHSVEVWSPAGELMGGLYGVAVGALFGAESMFHRARDASKIALVALVQHARSLGVRLLDVQVLNPHTASFGAVELPRAIYLRLAKEVMRQPLDWSGGGGSRGGGP